MGKRNEDLVRALEELTKDIPRGPFKPDAYYNTTGDFIEAIFEPVSYYAQWVNHRLTILRAQDDHRVVGCQVTWVKSAIAGEREWDER
jgi:hypothetical protein